MIMSLLPHKQSGVLLTSEPKLYCDLIETRDRSLKLSMHSITLVDMTTAIVRMCTDRRFSVSLLPSKNLDGDEK